jgi:hypothetical protein
VGRGSQLRLVAGSSCDPIRDAAGIEAMIPDEYTLGAHPFYGLALGGVRVLVRAGDWSRAVEFLDAPPGNPEDSSDG